MVNTSDDLAVSMANDDIAVSITNDDLTVSAKDDLIQFRVHPDLPDWVRMPPYHITPYHTISPSQVFLVSSIFLVIVGVCGTCINTAIIWLYWTNKKVNTLSVLLSCQHP